MTRGVVALIGGLASFVLCACTEDFGSDLEYDEFAEAREEGGIVTRDPRGGGGDDDGGTDIFIGNGLHDPEISRIDTDFGLSTPEGLAETTALLDPDHHAMVEYLIECALAPYQNISKVVDGQTIIFEGMLGLAPEWEADACDEKCQEWVSACMLARTNVSGDQVIIGLRSDHEAIGTEGSPNFPHYEASWYGNLFVDPPVMRYCEGDPEAAVAAQRQGRTCVAGECEFTNMGSCHAPYRCDRLDGTRVQCVGDDKEYKTLSTYVGVPQ